MTNPDEAFYRRLAQAWAEDRRTGLKEPAVIWSDLEPAPPEPDDWRQGSMPLTSALIVLAAYGLLAFTAGWLAGRCGA
jgi:hypothetical protein